MFLVLFCCVVVNFFFNLKTGLPTCLFFKERQRKGMELAGNGGREDLRSERSSGREN